MAQNRDFMYLTNKYNALQPEALQAMLHVGCTIEGGAWTHCPKGTRVEFIGLHPHAKAGLSGVGPAMHHITFPDGVQLEAGVLEHWNGKMGPDANPTEDFSRHIVSLRLL